MSTAIWWTALGAGTVLLIAAGAVIRRRTSGEGRIPRLGFFPPAGARGPWWSYGLLVAGVLLMTLGAGRLDDAHGGYLAYLGGAALVTVVGQALLVGRHNRSVLGGTGERARPGPSDAG